MILLRTLFRRSNTYQPHATRRRRGHSRAVHAPILWVLALAFAVSGALVSNAAAQPDDRPEIRVRLQFATPGGIYDPHYWRYTSDWFVYPNVFNWLVRWVPGSGGYQLEPDLAERWQVSDDGLEYTFSLREGVQFHRGYGELTADDVVFSFQRQVDDASSSFHSNFENVRSVEALDPRTVVVRLAEQDASFLSTVIAFRPGIVVSRAAVEELDLAGFNDQPVGTGPFVFEELTAGGEVILSAFDDYFRGPPEIRRLSFAHIGEEQVAVAALQRNEFQIIWTRGNPEAVAALEADPALTTQTIIRPDSVRHISFSANFAPTQDVLVRRALAHAIDKELIRQSFPGLEVPADVVFAGDSEAGSVPTYPYDPERARELLAEAGYPNGFPVTIMFETRAPFNILAEIVAALWEAVGLDVTLDGLEATANFDRRNALDFEVAVNSVGRPADADLLFSDLFLSTTIPPGGSNYFAYGGVDELILAGRRITDVDERAATYHAAHVQVMEDLPIVPLSYQAFTVAWRAPVVEMAHGLSNNFWGETIRVSP